MATAAFAGNSTAHLGSAAVSGFDTAYEMAYLRGGSAEIIRLALFGLIQRGALQITERHQSLTKVRRICRAGRSADGADPLEQAVHRFVASPRRASEMLAPQLRNEVEALSSPYRRALEERGYLRSPRQHRQLVAILVFSALGAGLLAFATVGIWPAVIFTAVAAILCRWWAPQLRASFAGHRAIKQARAELDREYAGLTAPPNVNAVAAFGLSILETTELDALALMFAKPAGRNDSDNTGCSGCNCGR